MIVDLPVSGCHLDLESSHGSAVHPGSLVDQGVETIAHYDGDNVEVIGEPKRKPKRVHLFLDSRTELTNEELQVLSVAARYFRCC